MKLGPPTTRDRWLLLVWPAMLVLVAWGARWMHFPDSTRAKVARLQARLGIVASESVPTNNTPAMGDKLLRAMAQRRQLQAEEQQFRQQQAELQAEHDRLQRDVGRLHAQLRGTHQPTSAMQALSALLERHGLQITRTSTATSEASRHVPPMLATVLHDPHHPARGQLWQLEFRGNYFQVQAAFDELEQCSLAVVPISLSMNEGELKAEIRSWTLLIWI